MYEQWPQRKTSGCEAEYTYVIWRKKVLSIAFCDDEPIMLEELFNVVKGYIDSKKVEFRTFF